MSSLSKLDMIVYFKMSPPKGYKFYKQHWEDQASFMDKQFSDHSLKKEKGINILRVKIPYNYHELDDFQSKSLELLGIQENWITAISLDNSYCSHR